MLNSEQRGYDLTLNELCCSVAVFQSVSVVRFTNQTFIPQWFVK